MAEAGPQVGTHHRQAVAAPLLQFAVEQLLLSLAQVLGRTVEGFPHVLAQAGERPLQQPLEAGVVGTAAAGPDIAVTIVDLAQHQQSQFSG
jgi:hypothetical protein